MEFVRATPDNEWVATHTHTLDPTRIINQCFVIVLCDNAIVLCDNAIVPCDNAIILCDNAIVLCGIWEIIPLDIIAYNNYNC